MKAVILEVKNGYAAVLKDDGTVVKIKDEDYKVGDVIRMKDKKPLFNKKWGTLVAALLIFAMVGTGTYVNAAPSFDVYVEDDGDFEVLFKVNKDGKVVDVYYDDDDEDEEFDDLYGSLEDLKGKEIEEAIRGFALKIDEDYENLYITASSRNQENTEEFINRIRERMAEDEGEGDKDRVREENSTNDEVEKGYEKGPGNIDAITNEMVKEAKEEGIAPGKLNIVNKLLLADDEKVVDLEKDYALTVERGQSLEEALIVLAKEKPEELMKIFTESRGKETAPGQLKKQEEVETQNRNIEQDTEEDQEMNDNKPESNPGNKGGNGKGKGNN